MSKQKFNRGDVVHIAVDLGQSMSHFEKDKDVVILGSYADEFGGNNTRDYTVLFEDGNECAWYQEYQLTFLRYGGEELISEIKKTRNERNKVVSDLGWIVDNWKKIRKEGVPGATMVKLMSLIGITSPYGNHGEGIDYYNHTKYTTRCLDAILSTGDIGKVQQFIADFPKVNEFIFGSDLYNGHNELRKPSFIP